MPRIQLELDQRTFDALVIAAVSERRPVPWHAEVIIQRAVGAHPDGPSVERPGMCGWGRCRSDPPSNRGSRWCSHYEDLDDAAIGPGTAGRADYRGQHVGQSEHDRREHPADLDPENRQADASARPTQHLPGRVLPLPEGRTGRRELPTQRPIYVGGETVSLVRRCRHCGREYPIDRHLVLLPRRWRLCPRCRRPRPPS